ncbi:MAG TPA: HAMP domain-containing sensor histidine kinase, partial [Pararhizobium sp.]|nr:HAMP domain-containing sensor histidine kinase [Pararhizobium sp.]
LAAGFAAAMLAGAAAAEFGVPHAIGAGAIVTAIVPVAGLLAYVLARMSLGIERSGCEASAEESAAMPELRNTYDLLPGMVTLHDPRGAVIAVHGADAAAWREWLKDPMGGGFLQQVHVGDRLTFLQALDELRQGQDRAAIELRIHCLSLMSPSEQFIHLHMGLAAIRDASGELQTILAQSRDVTAEAVARRQAAEKAEAAESANAAKTRFLAAVSHELRTPLSAIIGFSDVLADERFGALQNDRQREYVELIRQSGGHLLSVVNSLLDMSRVESGCYELSVEPVDVRMAVARCEGMLMLQARGKGVLLTSRVSRACGEIMADRGAIDQILINLVANAVKFTEKGGVVTIDAAMHGDRLRLSVSDTGIGISAEHLERVGEPFVQVGAAQAGSAEGAGLGLSLVKGLVALHGGGFAIRSRLGEGTVVTIELACDGSGVAAGRTGSERTIAFPPRLPAAHDVNETSTEGRDEAQARSA